MSTRNPSGILAILTATILPHETNGIYTVNQSEYQRYVEYKENLEFLIKSNLFSRLVFLDNSKSQYLVQLKSHINKYGQHNCKVEILRYPFEDESIITGKGFGEGYLIKSFFSELKNYADYDYFLKITGRYKILNLRRIVRSIENGVRCYPKLDFIGSGFRTIDSGVKVVSTAVMFSRIGFWKEFLNNCYFKVDDKYGLAYEAVVRKILDDSQGVGAIIGELELPIVALCTNTATNIRNYSYQEAATQAIKSLIADHLKEPKKINLRTTEQMEI